jgi:glutathione synthase/RimK-type ligase-like ATP-grasp enzyme
MGNLLILVDKLGEKKETFAEYLAQNIPGSVVALARFADIIYEVDGKNISITVAGIDKDIKFFDLVYFRRAGGDYGSSAATLAACLNHLNIRYFDTAFDNIGSLGSKFTSYLRLSLAGLPTIPSFFCFQGHIETYKEKIISNLGLPLVAKELWIQRGEGVFLIKTKEDFDKLPKQSETGRDHEFMFQKFVESNEEYRILVLKDTIGAFEEKIRTNPDEFRNNVALGAREEFLDINKIPDDIKDISIKAAAALDIQLAGVDITVDKKGHKWLLEVNRGPGLTYDTKISPELANLAKFFTNELKEK